MNRLKMRNVIHYVIILGASTFLWGCTDEPGPKVVPEPKWELDLVEDEPDPAWNAPESGIYQFSMTAIIRLSEFLEKIRKTRFPPSSAMNAGGSLPSRIMGKSCSSFISAGTRVKRRR